MAHRLLVALFGLILVSFVACGDGGDGDPDYFNGNGGTPAGGSGGDPGEGGTGGFGGEGGTGGFGGEGGAGGFGGEGGAGGFGGEGGAGGFGGEGGAGGFGGEGGAGGFGGEGGAPGPTALCEPGAYDDPDCIDCLEVTVPLCNEAMGLHCGPQFLLTQECAIDNGCAGATLEDLDYLCLINFCQAEAENLLPCLVQNCEDMSACME